MKNYFPEVAICLKEKGAVYCAYTLDTPDLVVKFFRDYIGDLANEELVYVNLDTQLRPINFISFTGGVDGCAFDSKAILKSALLSNARYGMMFHNHPSGNCTPSPQDIKATEKLSDFLKILNIDLLDHIIFGSQQFSFCREGLM